MAIINDWRQLSNNRKNIGWLTPYNNGFGTAKPESLKMADCRFETLSEVEIEW